MKGQYAQLIAELDAFPRAIGIAVAGLSEPQLRWRPAVGELSIVENVAHVRDLELEASTVKIRRVLSENKPVLLDFDGTAVAVASSYNEETFADAFSAFRLGRRRNIARLAELTEPDFMRTATFGDRNVTLAKFSNCSTRMMRSTIDAFVRIKKCCSSMPARRRASNP